MKIVIVGPGAIGSFFYWHLYKKTKNLVVLDKNQKRAALLQKKQLTLLSGAKKETIPFAVTQDTAVLTDADLIIICVKSYDTLAVANTIKPLCGKHTWVLSVQNGFGNLEILAEVLGEERVLGAVTYTTSVSIEPGFICLESTGQTIIGKKGKKLPSVLRKIRTQFNAAGMSTSIAKDFDSVLWSKLLINCVINPLTAILQLKNGDLLQYKESQTLMHMAASEAERIAKKKRIKLLYDDVHTKIETVCKATFDHSSLMLCDVVRFRRTEIEALNGALYKMGQNSKIPTPVNFMLYKLVKTIEQSYPQRYTNNDLRR